MRATSRHCPSFPECQIDSLPQGWSVISGAGEEGDQLRLDPRMAEKWTTLKIHNRYQPTVYYITISKISESLGEASLLTLDGREVPGVTLAFLDDQLHHAELKLRTRGRISPHE